MAKDKTNGAAPADDQIPDDTTEDGATESEIEVQIAADDIPPVPEPPPAAVSADEGIEALRANLDRERTGRLAAEARERSERERRLAAGKEAADSNLALVTGAIDNLGQANDTLEVNYAQALADGDHAAAAKINRQMNENYAKLQTLEAGKLSLEASAKKPAEVEPRVTGDPVEDFISGIEISPLSANWLRTHPTYVTNNQLNQKMIGAEMMARGEGHEVDTPAYFEYIETRLGLRQPKVETEEPMSSASEPSGRIAAPPPAAPVRGGGTLQNGRTPTTVRLSAAQREAAEMSGLSEIEYAKQLLAMEAEGKGH